jgi:hypothetical protein
MDGWVADAACFLRIALPTGLLVILYTLYLLILLLYVCNLGYPSLPTLFVCHSSEFTYNPRLWPRHELHNDFLNLSRCFNAQTSTVRVPDLDPKYNISILASKQVS